MTGFFNKYIPVHIRYFVLLFFSGILFFTFFRLIFVFQIKSLISDINYLNSYLKEALIMGLHFDTVIICYILIIPFLLFSVLSFFNRKFRLIYRISGLFIAIQFVLSFLIFAVDIPWFNYNFSRLNIAVFNWIETPGQMISMAFSETGFILYFIGFILVSALFCYLIWLIRMMTVSVKTQGTELHKNKVWINIFWIIILSYPLYLGMRGNSRAPLKQIDACISNNAIINQIALNPVFTFIKSFSNKISVLDQETAIKNTRKYLGVPYISEFDSPVARIVKSDSVIKRFNVVIILMESMTANNLNRFGNNENITPNLDSLAKLGLSFDNIWSAGKHTSNGIFSSIYSFPGIWSQPPTSNIERAVFSGFPYTLKTYNYNTWYFTTHDLSYDNLREFLSPNGIDTAIELGTYPKKDIVGMYGVADHTMFERGIREFTSLYKNRKSFFAAMMTTSNHGPYIIPAGIPFRAKPNPIERQAVEYSDWAIGYFMQMASEQSWFDSTIFIFTADHGANVGENKFDISLGFHHIPFIIYCPLLINHPDSIKKLGGQIDIFPTVMHLLNLTYINNTFGIDLLKEERPYIFFTDDNKEVCLNDTFLFIYSKDNSEQLFLMKNPLAGDVSEKYRTMVNEMKTYMFSMLQTAQWMIERKKTGVIYVH